MKRVCLALAVVVFSACGGSDPLPAAPTPIPPASVAGAWSGTLQGTQPIQGSFLIAAVMTLNQSGSTVTGTWAAATANGTVSGSTTTSNFTGTFTWNAQTATGAPCTGTLAVSGSAGGNTVTWTSPLVTGNCQNLPNTLTLAMQRR